jgi:large subunit ribosomal protein L4
VAVVKKYNLKGQAVGELTLKDDLIEATANLQMIKDYLVALRANARQWSANTKTRAEVNHSGQKPHPQKGTGRARQGYLGAAQYKGGGRVHGPRPKFDVHVRINKKERRAAVKHLLSEKIMGHRLHVLQYDGLEAPKTKAVADFLKSLKLDAKRVLFLGESFTDGAKTATDQIIAPIAKYDTFVKSMRNIPKLEFMLVPNVSGYDVAVTHDIVVMEPALDELLVLLGG